jgi:integrase
MFVIGVGSTLVSLTLPEQLYAGHVDFAWKRSVGWSTATSAAGVPGFRVHDLRHTAASVWLAAGADPKVVQRVLGQHATAAMTMDLYGHMVDANL